VAREPVASGRRTDTEAPASSTDGVVHTRDRTADGTQVNAPADRQPVRR
jgi:hypothetical protein